MTKGILLLWVLVLIFISFPASEILSQESDLNKIIKSGQDAEQTGNYTEALFYYSAAIDADPAYIEGYLSRGGLYKRMKNYVKSKADYLKVIKINDQNEQAFMELGFIDSELKNYADAVNDYTGVIGINPRNSDAYYRRGNNYSALGKLPEAAGDYSMAVELNPSNTDASSKLASLKGQLPDVQVTEADKKDETKDIVENNTEPVKEDNEKVSVNTNSGSDLVAEKKEEVAPVETKPDIENFILTGLGYFEKKQFKKALDEYDKAVQIDPNFYEAHYHKGRVYTELNDYDNAIAEYTKTIELDPNHEKAYINRGYIYNELKDYDKAIADFKKGVEINPNSSFGYYNMGVSYINLGNRDEAVKNFQQAARLGDTDTQQWLTGNGYSW